MKKVVRKLLPCLAWTLTATLPLASAHAGLPGEISAKAIFLNSDGAVAVSSTPEPIMAHPVAPAIRPGRPQQAGRYAGLRFWVDIIAPQGQVSSVSARRVFRSGENIALHLQPNRDTYLYVLNQGTSGYSTVLSPADGQAILSKANSVLTLPGPGKKLQFDSIPGIEKLVVVMSDHPLGNFAPPPGERFVQMVASNKLHNMAETSSKDLILEDDPTPSMGAHPATYAVTPQDSLQRGVVLYIDLHHE